MSGPNSTPLPTNLPLLPLPGGRYDKHKANLTLILYVKLMLTTTKNYSEGKTSLRLKGKTVVA